jgi:UDP-N-acetylglucosamine acyltransferase
VGPFAVIQSDVVIGDGCHISSHVVIKSGTELGCGNLVDVGAVLGGRPQHLAATDKVGRLRIGNENQIREHVTVHGGLGVNDATRIGNQNLIMVSTHVGHDCVIGDSNIMANNVLLAGHVVVEDRAYLSGAVAVHQFCRIGRFAMVGGLARVAQDVPPYVTVDGGTTCLVGLNSIGLRRAGMNREQLRDLKSAYRIAFRSSDAFEVRLNRLRDQFHDDLVRYLWEFLATGQRGFLQDRRGPTPATIKIWGNRPFASQDREQPRRKAA